MKTHDKNLSNVRKHVRVMGSDLFDDYNAVICLNCNGNNLHHYKVEIFDREEDQTSGLHLSIGYDDSDRSSDFKIIPDNNMYNNPSSRRHGITIFADCENCDAITGIHIYQHKGSTYIESEIISK